MSFTGRSPEDVYRYALRRDSRERTLTDGFGFSIVFINDETPICREFLLKFFVQLSHRTANRVRFIFFGEMRGREPEDRFQAPERFALNLIQRVFGDRAKPVEWSDLRPHGLELISNPEQTLARWVEQSAVPDNAGAAIRFAQRIGVASHVPCLLIFTDVGALDVHVLPIAALSADEVYEHVCHWVDEFYRENHDTLSRWDDVEKEIASLTASTRETLTALRSWRDVTAERARELREVAAAIAECEALRTAPREAWWPRIAEFPRRVVGSGFHMTPAFRQVVQLREAVRPLESFRVLTQRARRCADDLQNADTYEAVEPALRKLVAADLLSVDEHDQLNTAATTLRKQRAAIDGADPARELERWRATVPARPSYQQYCATTSAWQAYRPHRRANDEYSLFVNTLIDLNIAGQPDEGAHTILNELGSRLSPDNPQQFCDRSGPLHELIREYLDKLASSIPSWIDGSRLPVRWAVEADRAVDSAVIERRREEQIETRNAANARLLSAARAERDRALSLLAAVAPLYETAADDWCEVLDRHVPALRATREGIERELLDALRKATSTARPAKYMRPERFRRLTELLDEYDQSIAPIRYSFEHDPLVIPVRIAQTVPQATNANTHPHDQQQDTRARLAAIAAADEELGPTYDAWTTAAKRGTPDGALHDALRTALSANRFVHLTEGADDARTIFGRVNDGEIQLLCRHFGIPFSENVAETLRRLRAAVGADPTDRTDPVPDRDFDVFLSYHTPQHAEVEGVARVLQELGVKPRLDSWQILPGVEFKPRLADALNRCRACALFVGSEGIGTFQRREIAAACDAAKRGLLIVPVLLGAAGQRCRLPVPLQRYSYVRVASALDRAGIEQLKAGLSAV